MRRETYRKNAILIFIMVMLIVSLFGCGILEASTFFDGNIADYYNGMKNGLGEYGTGSTALNGYDKIKEKQSFKETDTATVMIYLNGSDLEEDYRSATEDIMEIIDAELSDNINVIIQTGGTKKWHIEGITDEYAQRFSVENNKLYVVDDGFGRPDMTDPGTLSDFIKFCSENYPAERNILILWNHGGGPVEGFGYDSIVEDGDSMTLDEMQTALIDGGVYFDFIGFDACLMASIETTAALCDYTDYMIFSEDFESSYGWEYSNWLEQLSNDIDISTEQLAKTIIDDFVKSSSENGSNGILALADMSKANELFTAWYNYILKYGDEIANMDLDSNFTQTDRAKDRGFLDDFFLSFFSDSESLSDYSLADAEDAADLVKGIEADVLKEALDEMIVYCSSTETDDDMCGLNVALPIDDIYVYGLMQNIYYNCGFPEEYIMCMQRMTAAQ